MKQYHYEHVVGFEETNLTGNVYYVNHLRWQGRCREMFLRDHAPDVLQELERGLALVTTRCSCEYLTELSALDRVMVRMSLADMVQNRILMRFEYWRQDPDGEQLVARGAQEVACLQRGAGGATPTAIPASLRHALEPYRNGLPEAGRSRGA